MIYIGGRCIFWEYTRVMQTSLYIQYIIFFNFLANFTCIIYLYYILDHMLSKYIHICWGNTYR